MIFSIKTLNDNERDICLHTLSSRAMYAIVGDAVLTHGPLSIVRVGDGERGILDADPTQPFTGFEEIHPGWNARLGIVGASVGRLQSDILEAGNTCTYFAPSVSGISFARYSLHHFFKPRSSYADSFFVNDWTHHMIQMLFEASRGVYIIHRDYERIIQNFQKDPALKHVIFDGCTKDSWEDNDASIEMAIHSHARLVLYSGGPGGKIIGPRIAERSDKVVLDVGNTLLPWSERSIAS